jgi:hypothetical protein
MNLSTTWPAWREPARTNLPRHPDVGGGGTPPPFAGRALTTCWPCCSPLLLGMALNFLSTEGRCRAGHPVSASTLLRIGVARCWACATRWGRSRAGCECDRDGGAVGGADHRLRRRGWRACWATATRVGCPSRAARPASCGCLGGDGDRRGDSRLTPTTT